jgi:hypothetical protein
MSNFLPVLESKVIPSFDAEFGVDPLFTSLGSGPETVTRTSCSMFLKIN